MDIINELSTRVATLERTVHGLICMDQVEKRAAEVYNDAFKATGRFMVRGDIVDWSRSPTAVKPCATAWTPASEEAISEHRRKPPRADFTVGVWWRDDNWKKVLSDAKNLCASRDLQKNSAPSGLDNGIEDREAYLKAWWDTRHTRGRYHGEHT